jgi:uncharacterized protein with GYD domain
MTETERNSLLQSVDRLAQAHEELASAGEHFKRIISAIGEVDRQTCQATETKSAA